MVEISREAYAALYGPTTGDQVRLGDTDLWIEVEDDLTFGGEEVVFGGGKSIRESMAQSTVPRSGGALDTVITNAVVLDHWGVVRADVGLRDGRIVALGRAGNPDIADGVHPDLVIGPGTDVISGEGKILTAGTIDVHVHLLSRSQVVEALATGTTTIGGGGTGPSEGSKATTVTPGAWHLRAVHRALDELPVNVLLMGKGNTVSAEGLAEQALAGAAAYKVHEDWGATPAAIDAALRAADEFGLQVALHSDSLNEAGYLESTLAAIGGRSIHAFHAEGAGGGHAPDILKVASHPHVIPGSTNPTLPHTVNTVAEHLDMLMVCHHLSPRVPEDLAFAESRIRATTIAAEDLLHDLGALSITSSDAQAMGRIGEVVCRTWQVAHVMKARFGSLGGPADNVRARRYVAKYTINPAIAHGIAHEVGSVEPGKLADLVLWDPRFFGIRPEVVIKGGALVWGALGDPNASIPTPQPVLMRPTLVGADGADHAVTFVSPAALDAGLASTLGLRRRLVALTPTRGIGKADMVNNDALPDDRHRPRDLRDHRRGRARDALARHGAATGPALRDVLMTAVALLLADGRLPVAGHTQSGGLEPALAAGLDDVPAYLALRLATVTRTEAATAVVTLAHLRRGEGLDAVYDAWAARTVSAAMRDTSRELGRGLLRLATHAVGPASAAGRAAPADGARCGRARDRDAVGRPGRGDRLRRPADRRVGGTQAASPRPGRGHVVGGGRPAAAGRARVRGRRPGSTHRHPRHQLTVDRAACRGPRRHHQEVVPCLRPPASCDWGSAARSGPASPR